MIIFSMVITLIAAALTVPAGFGLATMLTPVVLLWLPPHEAIAVVAIIHGAHNAWKLKVLRSSINIDAVKRYGWALILGAIIGSLLQSKIPSNPLLLVVGIALIILPLLSVTEKWTKLRLGETEDRIGGFGSGYKSDVWTLNLTSYDWTEVTTSTTNPVRVMVTRPLLTTERW